MNLEQRVQVLEQEVQLLKAQIQATLLDMQEHLLNNKYAVLHAEEPTKSAAVAEMPTSPAANNSAVKRVVLTPPEPEEVVDVRPRGAAMAARIELDDEDDIAAPPVVVKARPNGHRPMPEAEAPRRPQSEAARFNRSDWEDDEPQPARDPRPSEAPRRSRTEWDQPNEEPPTRDLRALEAPRNARTEWEIQPKPAPEAEEDHNWIQLENWVSQKVEKLGITRTRELINVYTRQERFSRQERDLLLEFVSVYDGAPKSSNGAASRSNIEPERPTIVPQTRALVDEIRTELRQKRAAAKQKNGTYQLSEQQELVMRLIAGILSAGDDPESSNGFGKR